MVEFEKMKSDPRLEMARIRTQSSFEEIMYFEEKECAGSRIGFFGNLPIKFYASIIRLWICFLHCIFVISIPLCSMD